MPATEVIGRDAELARTADFLDALASGPSGLVIEGEAGAGKTTLWLAAVEEARERGYRVLETRPVEAEAGLPFAGLGDLVGSVVDEVSTSCRRHRPMHSESRSCLSRRETLPETSAPSPWPCSACSAGSRDAGPVLVAVDDVQWLDPRRRRSRRSPGGGCARSRSGSCSRTAWAPMRRPGSPRTSASPRSRSGRSRWAPCTGCCTAARARPPTARAAPRPRGERRQPVLRPRARPRAPSPRGRALAGRAATGPRPPPGARSHPARGAAAGESRGPGRGRGALSADGRASRRRVADGETALRPALEAQVVELDGDRVRFTHPLLASAAYQSLDAIGRRELHRHLAELVADADERARHLRSRRTLRTPTSRARSRRRRSTPAREARPRRPPSCARRHAG